MTPKAYMLEGLSIRYLLVFAGASVQEVLKTLKLDPTIVKPRRIELV